MDMEGNTPWSGEAQTKGRGGTRTSDVMGAIRAKVAARALDVPATACRRSAALPRHMGVSPSTVVEAYDRLVAEGLIRARRGSGFYVASAVTTPLALAEVEPRRDREVDPFWVSRQSLDTDDAVPKPGCGWLPPEWMPEAALRRATRALARTDASVLTNYGSTSRLPCPAPADCSRASPKTRSRPRSNQLMLTGSGTQAIDLICRFLLRPGDTVLVDDPCYFNFRALLRAHQAKIVSVPYTPSGPDWRALRADSRD